MLTNAIYALYVGMGFRGVVNTYTELKKVIKISKKYFYFIHKNIT